MVNAKETLMRSPFAKKNTFLLLLFFKRKVNKKNKKKKNKKGEKNGKTKNIWNSKRFNRRWARS
jgi:hypothetical protein